MSTENKSKSTTTETKTTIKEEKKNDEKIDTIPPTTTSSILYNRKKMKENKTKKNYDEDDEDDEDEKKSKKKKTNKKKKINDEATLLLIKLIKKIFYYIYLSIATLCFAIIVFVFISIIITTDGDAYLYKKYSDLMLKDQYAYVERQLDNGDRFPEIYCLQNETAIMDVLKDTNLIMKMIKALEISNMPCVSAYHFFPTKNSAIDRMPNFIMLNKRFQSYNKWGGLTKWMFKFSNANKTSYFDQFIDLYGRDNNNGQYYFIFDPVEIGGSVLNEIEVKRSTSLCKFSDRKKTQLKFSIQFRCKESIFYKGGIYIDNSILRVYDDLSFCMQTHFRDTETKKVCS